MMELVVWIEMSCGWIFDSANLKKELKKASIVSSFISQMNFKAVVCTPQL